MRYPPRFAGVFGAHTVVETMVMQVDGIRGWRGSGYFLRPQP